MEWLKKLFGMGSKTPEQPSAPSWEAPSDQPAESGDAGMSGPEEPAADEHDHPH